MRVTHPLDNSPLDHLQITEHLTPGPADELVAKTYLGQAHFAGTGPAGTTCGDCIWWKHRQHWRKQVLVKPSDYDREGNLRRHHCLRPILGKAKRRIPHDAESCRLFEQAPSPLPLKRAR